MNGPSKPAGAKAALTTRLSSAWNKARDNDVVASFFASPIAMIAFLIVALLFFGALFAPWIAPTDPFNAATIYLSDSLLPPAWIEGGDPRYLLGTDDQGRDLLSTILYGLRISLVVGGLGSILAAILGIAIGLIAGFVGGRTDAFLMRLADVQLTFPAILIALLIDGVIRSIGGKAVHDSAAIYVLVVSIALSFWVQYARTIRGLTMVERDKDYVQAARLLGLSTPRIVQRHILPNVVGPSLIILTINLGLAVITEATLSFLGVGMPLTTPSLGTLISIGNSYLFSGNWWIVAFPSLTLAALVIAVNLLGDWLRDALNPKLR